MYHMNEIRIVMAELWDPDDLTRKCGSHGLECFYEKHCTDPVVRREFQALLDLHGQAFQKQANSWWRWVKSYLYHNCPRLIPQAEQILKGERKWLE